MRISRYALLSLLLITFYSSDSYSQVKATYSPSPRFFPDFGTLTIGKTKDQTITIHNQADTISHGPLTCMLTGPTGTIFSVTGPTSFTLNPGETEVLTVHFTPAAVGVARDTIFIDTDGINKNPLRYVLSGTGQAADTTPKITVAATQINFGSIVKGKIGTKTFTVTNVSDTALTLTGVVASPSTSRYSIVSGGGAFTLDSGKSLTVTVNFTPDTIANTLIDSIIVTSNAAGANSHIRVTLSGAGIPPDTTPKITLSIGAGGFGAFLSMGSVAVGNIGSTSFTIKNTSDTIRTLMGSVGTTFTSNYSVVSGGGSFTLDTGKIVTVSVTFTPDTVRQYTDSLIITSNAASPNNRIKVTIFGQGIKADTFPQMTTTGLQQGRLNFGNDTLPKTKTLSFTIRNSSQVHTTLIGNVGNPAYSSFSITTGGGAFSLDSGMTKTISVSFTPDSAGLFLDTMAISTNSDGANQNIKIALSGTGYIVIGPHMIVTPGSLNFGSKVMGSAPVSMTAKIINNSTDLTDPLTGVVSSPKSPFSIISGGGNFSALAQHDTIRIIVQMLTTTVGTFKDTVAITSNSNDNAKTFTIILTGTVTAAGSVNGSTSINNYIAAMPNPFNGKTTISFSLTESSPVSMKIFDVLGKEVFSSPENIYPAGAQQIEWNAGGYANGEYLCALSIGKETRTIRVILSK